MKGNPLIITVKVIPGSSKNELVGNMANGVLKVRISAAPEKGKANKELINFLSEEYSVPKKNIKIISGEHSPVKVIEIIQ